MEKVIKELYSINEVSGICVSEGNIIRFQVVKGDSADVEFPKIISALGPLRKWCSHRLSAGREFVAVYKEAVLVGVRVAGERWLTIYASTESDSKNILFHAGVAAEKLKTSGLNEDKKKPTPLSDNEKEQLELIFKAVISVAGPIGDIICNAAEKRWLDENVGGRSLQALIDLVAEEMDDPVLSDQFEQKVADVLTTA